MKLNELPSYEIFTEEEQIALKLIRKGGSLEWHNYKPLKFKDSEVLISFDTFFSLSEKEYVKLVSDPKTRIITVELTTLGQALWDESK